MNILCLYNNECAIELFQWIKDEGHAVTLRTEIVDSKWCKEQGFDLAVSYTYRYIIPSTVIEALDGNIVNLHNSILPFNRGADPNLWSIVERTPRGVSLHYIDSELDKGYIIAQRIVNDTDEETLASSYYNLDKAAKCLFKDMFGVYEYWPELKKKAIGKGSYHSVLDGVWIKELIDTYDISIKELRQRLKKKRYM